MPATAPGLNAVDTSTVTRVAFNPAVVGVLAIITGDPAPVSRNKSPPTKFAPFVVSKSICNLTIDAEPNPQLVSFGSKYFDPRANLVVASYFEDCVESLKVKGYFLGTDAADTVKPRMLKK
jgi:hypothetical protein